MNKHLSGMIVTFLMGSLFVSAAIMVIDPTAIAQTHGDLLAPVPETDRDSSSSPINDPAAERPTLDSTQVAGFREDKPTRLVGKVFDTGNRELSNTIVILTEADGMIHQATSDTSGTFRFDEIHGDQQIRLSAENSRYSFTDLSIAMSGETSVGWRATGR
jgi:hypothetical protein